MLSHTAKIEAAACGLYFASNSKPSQSYAHIFNPHKPYERKQEWTTISAHTFEPCVQIGRVEGCYFWGYF